jgi:hypothetical protein
MVTFDFHNLEEPVQGSMGLITALSLTLKHRLPDVRPLSPRTVLESWGLITAFKCTLPPRRSEPSTSINGCERSINGFERPLMPTPALSGAAQDRGQPINGPGGAGHPGACGVVLCCLLVLWNRKGEEYTDACSCFSVFLLLFWNRWGGFGAGCGVRVHRSLLTHSLSLSLSL